MALQRDVRYPGRWTAANSAHPQGAFKNRTAPGSLDGSYIEQDWANDWDGFFARLMTIAGMTANGTIDTATSSQYYDALLAAVPGRMIGTPRIITASGTVVPTAGTKLWRVRGVGGGGGGGGAVATNSTQVAAGAGGASGSWFETIFTAAQIGSGIAVIVGGGGAGGTAGTTGGFGGGTIISTVTAPGGQPGAAGGAISTTVNAATSGGLPGGTTTGATILNSNGMQGGHGFTFNSTTLSGSGGSSPYGAGGRQAGAAQPGSGYGAGGGGGQNNISSAASPGAAGSPGVLIIEEYS